VAPRSDGSPNGKGLSGLECGELYTGMPRCAR